MNKREPQFALSLRNPWWWFILHGGKNIENRDWRTHYRGLIWIHASQWYRAGFAQSDFLYAKQIARRSGHQIPAALSAQELRQYSGAIVGCVTIVDCVERSRSRWFNGPYGFVLVNPKPLRVPILCKGARGLFDVSSVMKGTQ